MATFAPGEMFGPYRCVRVIGKGGFGTTILAVDSSDARVAVKVLHTDHLEDPAARERFEREMRAGARLRSQYFARILDNDLAAPEPWIAFSYIEGRGLRDVLREGPLEQSRALEIARQLLEALQELASAGLTHRDLKPDNIRIGPNDALTVLDLGIAASPEWSRLTTSLAPIGSIKYMSPEQHRGAPPSPAMDIWAFGVILAELTGGRYPFPLDLGPAALINAKLRAQADLSGVPQRFRPTVSACLDPDPVGRPTPAHLLGQRPRPAQDTTEAARTRPAPTRPAAAPTRPTPAPPTPARRTATVARPTADGRAPARTGWLKWVGAAAAGAIVFGGAALAMANLLPQGTDSIDDGPPVSPTASASPTPGPGTPTPSPSADGSANRLRDDARSLYSEVSASAATARTLEVGQYVPQISSKCAGLQRADLLAASGTPGPDGESESYPQGITEADILSFHQGLRTRVGEPLLLVEGDPIDACAVPRMWVTLVDHPEPTEQAILDWCQVQGFPDGECQPRQWSERIASAARYEPQVFSTDDDAAVMRVPHWMVRRDEPGGGAAFTDQDSGATLTVSLYSPPSLAPSKDVTVARGAAGADAPPEVWEIGGGFVFTGIDADGDIYYGRRWVSPATAVDAVWEYPKGTKTLFDEPVSQPVTFL